jgi:hypothetical protein
MRRGGCPFSQKASHAQRAGYAACLVVDTVDGAADGSELVPPGLGEEGDITVPVVMVTKAAGEAILENAGAGASAGEGLVVTLSVQSQMQCMSTGNGHPCLATKSLVDHSGAALNPCGWETEEQLVAAKYVRPGATVLELGARFGAVSVVLDRAVAAGADAAGVGTGASARPPGGGRVVSVEADVRVLGALRANRLSNGASFKVVHGVVTKRETMTLRMQPMDQFLGWGSFVAEASNEGGGAPAQTAGDVEGGGLVFEDAVVEGFSVERLEASVLNGEGEGGRRSFDTLVADCEGCLVHLLAEFPGLLKQLHTVVYDVDGWKRHEPARRAMEKAGFAMCVSGHAEAWSKGECADHGLQ